jgi:hypothetical protein
MKAARSRGRYVAAIGIVAILVLVAVAGLGGCGGASTTTTYGGGYDDSMAGAATTVAWAETTAAPATTTTGAGASSAQPNVSTLTGESGQKIIGDAVIDIEVARGGFQTAFTNAALLSDRYGGYIVTSESAASGEDGRIDGGTVAVRVPVASFGAAIADVGKLGTIKNQQIKTQDVTEEYVDLQARIANAQAKLDTFRKLFDKATTVEDIVKVQQVVTAAQDELEQLVGRQRYLQEHTSYSTLTINIREAGVVATTTTTTRPPWGVGKAFGDGARNLVKAVNAIIRALGIIIPVLVVLAIIAYIIVLVRRWNTRRHEPPARPASGTSGAAPLQAAGDAGGERKPEGASAHPEVKS